MFQGVADMKRLIVSFLSFALLLSSSDAAVCQSPAPKPDKNLFGLRAAAYQQRQLAANPQNLEQARLLAAVIANLDSLVSTLDKEGVDSEVIGIARDLKRFATQYEAFLVKCDVIDSNAVAKAAEGITFKERADRALGIAAEAAIQKTAVQGFTSLLEGDEFSATALAAYAGGIFTVQFLIHLIDSGDLRDRKGEKIMQARLDEIKKARDALIETINADFTRHKSVVKALTAKYKWGVAEGGLDASAEEQAPFNESLFNANGELNDKTLATRIAVLGEWKKRRPRDPFATLEYCHLAGLRESRTMPTTAIQAKASAKELANLSAMCREAAKHVPAEQAFDEIRSSILKTASDLTEKASTRERMKDHLK
jgi:hypothetical protein